jgi:hopene-associated glycosyltransferase HpnB
MPLLCLGALSCLIWVILLAAWGQFWRVTRAPSVLPRSTPLPSVAVVIPARNEAETLGQVLQSLLNQDYLGPLRIYLVDDHSTDATAQVASAAGDRVTVISSPDLPAGWTGKMWALEQGVRAALEFSSEYFLFTDADIVHTPSSLSSLVALARSRNLDLVSMMVKLRCESFAERALMPAFVFFFFLLYPPNWVNDRRKKTAAAAGGDILVSADALKNIGGIATIRDELIDDCALAREIKHNGAIWLGLTNDASSVRTYNTFATIGRMISRNAFYQLRHSFWMLIATLVGLCITYVAPPLVLFAGLFSNQWAALFGGLAWLFMSLSFLPMVRFYRISPAWAVTLPIVAVFYAGATVHSAVQYWLGRGGEWKGRVQDTKASTKRASRSN